MKCPTCQFTMHCRSAIRQGSIMDLHCFNSSCSSHETSYRPHMEVVLGKGKAPWRCRSYHFPFKEKGYGRDGDTWYIMEGKEGETTLYERSFFVMSEKLIFNQDNAITQGFITLKDKTIWDMEMVVSINKFRRLSTGDKMHEEAQKLFDELKRIDIYTDYSMEHYYPSSSTTYHSWEERKSYQRPDFDY